MLRLFFGTVGAFFRMGKKGLTGAGKADMIDSTLIGNEPALPVHGGIVHAYRDTIGTISLKCRILPGSILDIIVKDRGCGIADVAQARTPMFSTGGDERSGMGFTIMESFMTELRVTSTPGKGTTVHMKRKIVRRGEKA